MSLGISKTHGDEDGLKGSQKAWLSPQNARGAKSLINLPKVTSNHCWVAVWRREVIAEITVL